MVTTEVSVRSHAKVTRSRKHNIRTRQPFTEGAQAPLVGSPDCVPSRAWWVAGVAVPRVSAVYGSLGSLKFSLVRTADPSNGSSVMYGRLNGSAQKQPRFMRGRLKKNYLFWATFVRNPYVFIHSFVHSFKILHSFKIIHSFIQMLQQRADVEKEE